MSKLSDLISQYFECSVSGNFEDFPFEEFFRLFKERLKEKLALHGVLAFEDYLYYVSKYYDLSQLSQFSYTSVHTGLTEDAETIKRRLFLPRYQHFHDIFILNKKYRELLTLYHKLLNPPENRLFLVEECVHAEHGSGLILGIDLDKIRRRIDGLRVDKPFGILTRNALEEELQKLDGFNCLFLDFEDVHKLNAQYGYDYVNELMQKVFATFPFRKTDLVGRWFSGDEILIATNADDIQGLGLRLKLFVKEVSNGKLNFRYEAYEDLTSIDDLKQRIKKTDLKKP